MWRESGLQSTMDQNSHPFYHLTTLWPEASIDQGWPTLKVCWKLTGDLYKAPDTLFSLTRSLNKQARSAINITYT